MVKRDNRGQAAVLIAMMISTFILFFAFVVNTGMLVNAKINLQNAADLAAYSGAAVQARQLTQISFLNYEMRRQYKKLLFRYYVMGNMAQRSHPTAPKAGPRWWSPNGRDPAQDPVGQPAPLGDGSQGRSATDKVGDFEVPTVCVQFGDGAYCAVYAQAALPTIGGNSGDPIQQTLANVFGQIELKRQSNCFAQGRANMTVALSWLFNTDMDFSKFAAVAATAGSDPGLQEVAKRLTIIRGLAFGLGIVPREILTHLRIKSLEDMVNSPPLTGLTRDKTYQFYRTDPITNERSIQAFFSAYNTLGNHTFEDVDSIQMDEILPVNGKSADLLSLQDINAGFDMYATDLSTKQDCSDRVNGVATGASTDPLTCYPCITPISISQGSLPVGVKKDPSKLTYYALKLTAKAQVMFNPFGDGVTLTAYSAAQPFGSRIGPALTESDFVVNGWKSGQFCGGVAGGGAAATALGTDCVGAIPNLPVQADEAAPEIGNGWDTNLTIGAMFQKFGSDTNNTPNQLLNEPALRRAYQASSYPNPWELGKYNIPVNDVSSGGKYYDGGAVQTREGQLANIKDPYVQNFDDDGNYAFWAPIAKDPAEAIEKVKQAITDIAKPKGTAKTIFTPEFQKTLADGITDYVQNRLSQGNGENNEGLQIARIADPLNTRKNDDGPDRHAITWDQAAKDKVVVDFDTPSNVLKLKSSWAQTWIGDYQPAGRTGYSVKFVAFKQLLKPGKSTSDGTTPWVNIANLRTGDLNDIADKIQH